MPTCACVGFRTCCRSANPSAAAAMLLAVLGGNAAFAAAPTGLTWDNHVDNNDLVVVEVFGDSVWFGSNAGGVVEFNSVSKTFTTYTQSVHGLPSNTISDLSISPSGDVWIATPRGAALRPAGSGPNDLWVVFDSNNSPLLEDFILAVEADPAGGVWMGTFNDGAFHFDGLNWTQLAPFNSPMSDTMVHSIVVDDAGAVWFGHFANSVDRFDGVVWTNFTGSNTGTPPFLCGPDDPAEDLGIISGFVRVLGQDPFTGRMWFDNQDDGGCLLNGTTVFDGVDWDTYTPLNSNIHFRTEDVAADSSGLTWLVSLNGIQQFDNGVITTIATNGAPESARGVAIDTNKSTWFATPLGIFELTGGAFMQYPPLGLNDNSINDLAFRQVSGAVEAWVAHGTGVQRFDGTAWNLLTPENSPLSSFSNSAVAIDLDNNIWIGSSIGGAGVHRTDGVNWTTFTTENSELVSTAISDIAVDPVTGSVWFGDRFSSGLSMFDGEDWASFRSDGAPFSCVNSNGVPGRPVADIEVDSAGVVWIGSGCGLTRYDGVSFSTLTTEDGLVHNNVRDIHLAPDGSIWIGTQLGVSQYRDGQFRSWLSSRDVRTVTSTPDGVWISMFNIGVALFDGIDWIQLGIQHGLVSDRVFWATGTHPQTQDPWFGTEGGIAIVSDLGQPGDVDGDGDVDENDLDMLADCMAGPRVFLPPPGCSQAQFEAADIHNDGDVDLSDAASLLIHMP